jgi:hypothetical protein
MGTLVLSGATSGSTTLQPTDATTQTLTLPGQTGNLAVYQSVLAMKNRIINGAMVIDQRNAGSQYTTPTTSSGTYTLDRYAYYVTQASKFTVQQNAGSVTPPVGFTNYLGITSTSAYSVGSSDIFMIYQKIEGYNVADLGWGTANAKTVTLSFQVYSSLTGTFGGSIASNNTANAYLFSYSVPVANTWTTISVTIPGPTSGTWLTNNGWGISVVFGLGAGSTYTNTAGSWLNGVYTQPTSTVSVVGTNGATFYITGVQLEVGSAATTFDYRMYGTELALCQRYYQLTNNYTGVFYNASGTAGLLTYSQMRTSPTLGLQGPYSMTDGYALDYLQSSSSISINAAGAINNVGVYANLANFSSGTTGRFVFGRLINTNQITLSAEL